MGFLSALGKIGKGLLGAVPVIGDVASVLGAQEGDKSKGKITQAQLNQAQDRNAIDLFNSAQNAQFQAGNQDLQRQGFTREARNTDAKTALIAALLNGGMPGTSIKGGTATGGLAAKLRTDPDAMAAMRNLQGQADKAQMAVPAFTGGNLLAAPQLTALPQVDKGGFLSALARVGQLAGAAAPLLSGIGSGDPGPSPFVGSHNAPQLAGVTPFVKPPTAKFPIPGLEDDADWSNR